MTADPTDEALIAINQALEYGSDVRWDELARGSPFGVVDRRMLRELHTLCCNALSWLALTQAPTAPEGEKPALAADPDKPKKVTKEYLEGRFGRGAGPFTIKGSDND